jgi:hypothetical protein
MRRLQPASALIAALGLALLFPAAAPAQDEPVTLTVSAPSVVAAKARFKLGVRIEAEAGALDIAARPLRLRVRMAPECGGTFDGTEGPTAIDRSLIVPTNGAAYDASISARTRLTGFGTWTVCAFLEDAEQRQFATSTDTEVTVSRQCTVASKRLARARRALRRARHAHRARRRTLAKKVRRLARRKRGACRSGGSGGGSGTASGIPHIKHLFVIALENRNAAETFGANPPSPYLGRTMRQEGAFLPDYYGIGHESLDNYIAMISGQPPNVATQSDCQLFTEMLPGTLGADGVATGQGCVFPATVETVANQLEVAGLSWGGYMQDMANSVGAGQPATCRHPPLNAPDPTQKAGATDQYAARHDPFVYFHSIIDSPTCQRNVVDLGQLASDLAGESSTPNYSFITPDLCADGHDETCADGSSPGGFAGIDAFLREWVPRIERSPAYRDRGMILVTFDESESGAESCCGETTGPNTVNNGGPDPGAGGGRVGAVAVSPCIEPGTVTTTPYNHYSLLRWVEDNFGLPHLANAGPAGLRPFGADLLDRASCQ